MLLLMLTTEEVGSVRRYQTLKSKFQKVRHAAGKYKYKEEVIKKIEHDHPCKLTQTSVKVIPTSTNIDKIHIFDILI